MRRVSLDPEHAVPILQDLPPEVKRRIKSSLKALSADPTGREARLDVKELVAPVSSPRVFRLRVGEWRVVYIIEPRQIQVVAIFHRSQGYAWMERLRDETA